MMVDTTKRRKFTDYAQHVLLYGTDELNVTHPISVDSSSHCIIAIDHAHHEVHSGNAFRYTDALALASGVSQDYLLTVPNTTKWPHLTFAVDGTAVTTIEVFRATDKTGTTLQTTFNADENNTTITAGMTVHKGTSGGTIDGTSIFKYSSGTASGSANIDYISAYFSERILRQNTKYLMRVISGTNGNLVNVRLEWYEHTAEA